MVQVYCDSCNKEIRKPVNGVNYIPVLGHDLCLSCRDELVRQTSKEVHKRGPFQWKTYKTVYEQTLRRMCK